MSPPLLSTVHSLLGVQLLGREWSNVQAFMVLAPSGFGLKGQRALLAPPLPESGMSPLGDSGGCTSSNAPLEEALAHLSR